MKIILALDEMATAPNSGVPAMLTDDGLGKATFKPGHAEASARLQELRKAKRLGVPDEKLGRIPTGADLSSAETAVAKLTMIEVTKDAIAMDRATVRTRDVDGRLHVAITNISKANVCPYWGHEIPDPDNSLGLDPEKKYMLLRDGDELAKSAPTFNNIQVLSEHQPVDVTDHQPSLIIGSTGTDAIFEYPYLKNSLVIWAQKGIDGIEDGSQCELSCGYRYRADMTPGVSDGGETYDGVMRDIVGNHIACVSKGRAGPDVLVGDSQFKEKEITMSKNKLVLSRKAAMTGGALYAYLMPRLAADAVLDLTPYLKGLTQKNFASKKASIIAGITKDAKLGKDMALDGFPEMMENVEKEKVDEDEAPEMKPEGEEQGRDCMDEAKNFLAGKLSTEDMATYDSFFKKDGAEEETEDGEVEEGAGGEEAGAAVANAEGEGGEPMIKRAGDKAITKVALDKALETQRASIMKQTREAAEAREYASAWVGKLPIALDSAYAVYKVALDSLKVDIKDVHPSAYRAVLAAQPKPSDKKSNTIVVGDAAPTKGFNDRYPTAARIGTV